MHFTLQEHCYGTNKSMFRGQNIFLLCFQMCFKDHTNGKVCNPHERVRQMNILNSPNLHPYNMKRPVSYSITAVLLHLHLWNIGHCQLQAFFSPSKNLSVQTSHSHFTSINTAILDNPYSFYHCIHKLSPAILHICPVYQYTLCCLNPKVDTPPFATTANPLQLYHSLREKILTFKCVISAQKNVLQLPSLCNYQCNFTIKC